uniref:Smolstatin n=1 Tax=Sphaerospora molnari TaxID=182359 RepID=UPI00311CE1B7
SKLVGGFSEWKDPDAYTTKIVKAMESKLFEKLSLPNQPEVSFLRYREQIVSGVNYCMRVKIGSDFYDLHIYVPLGSTGDIKSHLIQLTDLHLASELTHSH